MSGSVAAPGGVVVRWYNKIAFKVSATAVAVILALVAALGLFFFHHMEADLEAGLRSRGLYIARTLAQQAVEPILYEDRLGLYTLVESFRVREAADSEASVIAFAAIDDHAGGRLAAVGEEGEAGHGLDRPVAEATIFPAGPQGFVVAAPVVVRGVSVGTARVGISRRPGLARLHHLQAQVAAMALALAATTIGVGLFLSRRFILPLLRLASGARRIGEGRWGDVVAVTSRDEIGLLATAFNDMSCRLRDAFERIQQTQERLVENEKLSTLGRFSANLAHALKNPLNSVKLSVQVMEQPGAEGRLDAAERAMVLGDIERMDAIISRFLQYGAPDRLNRTPQDVHRLLDRVVAGLQPQLDAAAVRVVTDYDRALPPLVVDPKKLGEAVANLLVNALQAMAEGGEVHLRTEGNGGGGRIVVADSGPGLDPAIRDHLFEPFHTTHPGGSGLGLSIVYQVVKEHGGEITVESATGKGTTFTITLPAVEG